MIFHLNANSVVLTDTPNATSTSRCTCTVAGSTVTAGFRRSTAAASAATTGITTASTTTRDVAAAVRDPTAGCDTTSTSGVGTTRKGCTSTGYSPSTATVSTGECNTHVYNLMRDHEGFPEASL